MSYEHQNWETITFNKKSDNKIEDKPAQQNPQIISTQAKIEADIDAGKLPKTYGHEYGKKVQTARCEKKLTQEQLAQQLNVKKDIIQKVENGTGLIDGSICSKLFRVLGVKRN